MTPQDRSYSPIQKMRQFSLKIDKDEFTWYFLTLCICPFIQTGKLRIHGLQRQLQTLEIYAKQANCTLNIFPVVCPPQAENIVIATISIILQAWLEKSFYF